MKRKWFLVILIFILVILSLYFLRASLFKTSQLEEASVISKPIHWNSRVSPNGLYRVDSYTYDYKDRYTYFRLFLTNTQTGQTKKIYSGDYRTLGWEWTPDNQIRLKWDCGTACLASRIINVDEGYFMKEGDSGWTVQTFPSFPEKR